jgi:hypothetical protein
MNLELDLLCPQRLFPHQLMSEFAHKLDASALLSLEPSYELERLTL